MARSIEQRGHHVTCALVGTCCKLAAYDYMRSLALWTTLEYKLVNANGGIQKVSTTCYQECGCHLLQVKYSLSTHSGTSSTQTRSEELNLATRTAKTAAVSNFHLVQSASELLPATESSSKIFWKTFRRMLCLQQSVISSHRVTSASWELFHQTWNSLRWTSSYTHMAWEWLITTEATGMASMQTIPELIASTRC